MPALIGDYQLVSWSVRVGDETRKPFGPAPTGRLSYAVTGRMWAALMDPERKRTTAVSVQAATRDQQAAAARGYLSYCGRFTEVSDTEVHHHVELSLLPDWVGTTQRRLVRWEGLDLVLSTPAANTSAGLAIVNELRWKQLPRNTEVKDRE